MSQISPPIRIAVIAAIAFLGVWTMFLRPGAEEPTPAPTASAEPASAAGGAPAESAAGQAVEKANLTAADADAKAAALVGEASVPGATTAAAGQAPVQPGVAAVKPERPSREALAQLPRDVARAVRQEKVIALLFWNPKAADDRRVHHSLQSIKRFNGDVFVKTAGVDEISRYAPITRGANVQQAPTVVIVDRNLQSESLVGYVARTTIS